MRTRVHELTFRYRGRRGAVAALMLMAIAWPASTLGAPSPAYGAAIDIPNAPASVHPRLLFSAVDVSSLRARSAAGGVAGSAWARLHEQAEALLARVQPDAVRQSTNQAGPYGLQNEMPTYLLNLGLAYQLSGDVRYGRRVVDLLLALKDANYPYWCCQDLGVGDLLYGMALGFDWSYELMTPDERRQIVSAMWTPAHESFLFGRTLGYNPTNPYAANLEISNWMGVTAGGAGLALLAVRGEPGIPADTIRPFDSYLRRALDRTKSYFVHGIDPLGANHEGLTYAYYGLKNSVPFALAARRDGLGDLIAGTGLPAVARWAASEQLPGEGQNFVPLNDSQRESRVEFEAMMFAIAPDSGVAQWLWQRTVGTQGNDYFREPHLPETAPAACPTEPPSTFFACDQDNNARYNTAQYVSTIVYYQSPSETPEVDPASVGALSVHYAQRGLVDARTGFAQGGDEVISTFEALRDGRGHFQYDAGNFTIYGKGGRFAIDPGYACVACGQDLDEAYATAHNVVVVDGARATQSPNMRYWRGTTIDSFVNAPNLSLAHADLRYAYSADPNAQFDPLYAGRDHLLSRTPGRPVIVAVADQLQRDRSPTSRHSYTWQMLSDKQNRVETNRSTFTITAVNGSTLVGRTAASGPDDDPVIQTRTLTLRNPTSDIGSSLPVIYSTTPSQLGFDHLAVMALTAPGSEPVRTQTLRVSGGNAISVTWRATQDVIVRKLAAAREVTGQVKTDADIAKFTRDAGETVIQRGTRLSSGRRDYISVSGSAATVTVSGDQVQASGSSENTYRVFAPQTVTSVLVNGAPVATCRDGSYLLLPCS
ncbi:MAG: hypothetical protein QOD83_1242 [Solirubrobacteraceae bacterium]|jgi:hypothetical protein|nr:hypothetical protein [Solirubrobacteraceae bacterium]